MELLVLPIKREIIKIKIFAVSLPSTIVAPGNLYHIPHPAFFQQIHQYFFSFSVSCSMNIQLPPYFLFCFVESIVKLHNCQYKKSVFVAREIRINVWHRFLILSSFSICYWQFANLTLPISPFSAYHFGKSSRILSFMKIGLSFQTLLFLKHSTCFGRHMPKTSCKM